MEFEVIWRSFGRGFNPGTSKVRFTSCFGGSIPLQRVLLPRHKIKTYQLIFSVVIVLEY